jgi:hypothetical protein
VQSRREIATPDASDKDLPSISGPGQVLLVISVLLSELAGLVVTGGLLDDDVQAAEGVDEGDE